MKSPNYGVLEYAGARRVKRTWVRTAVTLLVLFLLSMLTGWLVSCVRHAARGEEHGAWSMGHGMSPSLQVSESPLLAGVPDWLAVGIVVLLVALLLARWVWGVVVGGDEAEGDPLAETAVGLVPEEVGRIVDACRREARAVMMLIESAQTALCADDVTDMLRLADGKMKQLVRTLGELQRGVNTSAQCSVLSGEAWPFCKACESWHARDLKCVGSVSESPLLRVSKSSDEGGSEA